MPRFVVLRHDPPPSGKRPLHWDFMLESGEALRTWALAQPPDEGASGSAQPAEALADHRIVYLEFAGEVSGGRGHVSRYDHGDYHTITWQADQIVVELYGRRLRGRACFALIESQPLRWSFSFSPATS
jgi:hypothetical protein